MKKFFKSMLIVTLCFSLVLTNVISYREEVKAAAIVPVLTWGFWETLFLSLGITLSLGGEASADVQQERADEVKQWVIDMLAEEGYTEDEANSFINDGVIANDSSVSAESFTLKKELYDKIKDATATKLAVDVPYTPVSDICLADLTNEEFVAFIEGYFEDDISESMASHPKYSEFMNRIINNWDYNKDLPYFFITYAQYDSYERFNFLTFNWDGYGFAFRDTGELYSNNSYAGRNSYSCSLFCNLDGSTSYLTNVSYESCLDFSRATNYLFCVNGYIYNPYDVFASDIVGFKSLEAFKTPSNVISTNISNGIAKVKSKDKTIASLHANSAYDILTEGQTYDEDKKEVVGDVVLNIPDYDGLVEDVVNGIISWEDAMEEIGATPIDTVEGVNLLTDEFLSVQTGILGNTESILDVVQGVLDAILSLPLSIADAILSGLYALVVPSDGFIEEKVEELQHKLGKIGVVPYDMSNIFDSGDGDNPFKDIKIEVYGTEVTIVSFAYLPQFLDKFRPVIRGLMVLLMLFYSINQLLGLLRLSGMIEGGNINLLGHNTSVGSDVPRIANRRG